MSNNEIVDFSTVSPQQTFLNSGPEKIPATSTLYLDHFITENLDQSLNHTIVGVHIVIKKGDPLWDSLNIDRSTQKLDPNNPKVATRSLRIYCDTLELQGRFCVPEADVSIFARRMVFADFLASINTAPLQWAYDKAQNAEGSQPGKNGASGRKPGSIQVFVSEAVINNYNGGNFLGAVGGSGQAPGAGMHGQPGRSMARWSERTFEFSADKGGLNRATVKFSTPAVYIKYHWRWRDWVWPHTADGTVGEDSFPGNGTDAVAPGIPGEPADGGDLTTNSDDIARLCYNEGGRAGAKERDCRGGDAGQPTPCAKYEVTLSYNPSGTAHAEYTVKETAKQTTPTSKGKDAPAQSARRDAGVKGKRTVISEANAWLHPLSLQKALEYARDLFLAGERDEVEKLVNAYGDALRLEVPTKNDAWDETTQAQWTAAQSEVASMLQRLHGHLDYFGNAAGYTPLFSLAASAKLYEDETQRALRTIMLANWIEAKERKGKVEAAALAETIESLKKETQKAAAQVVNSERQISEVTERVEDLQMELESRSRELDALRAKLLDKAKDDLERKARVMFSIKMAAALCQVIPVGQPALGAAGSLASIAGDYVLSDEKPPDTFSKIGEVFKDTKKAYDEAKKAREQAAKEQKGDRAKDADAAQKADAARKKASAWATAGKGIGPAFSQVSQGIKALQVPKSEVEAQLQRLESESEEWKAQVKKIRELNERKTAFATALAEAVQSLAEAYARVSSNAAATVSLQQERAEGASKIDPAAASYVRQMGQRSRLTLLKYLYFMIKSYETTVFEPIDVDWKLTQVTDKISEMLKPDDDFDAATLNDQIKILEPLYRQNIDRLREQLREKITVNEQTLTLQLGLSSRQTPDLIAGLNESGQVTIDPLAYGLVLPDFQMARLSRVELKELEFDPGGPPLSGNIVVSLKPAHAGTMRKGAALYSVYSDEPLEWRWTYVNGQVRDSSRSDVLEDILDMIFGKGEDKGGGQIRQRVALPPMWSDLILTVAYSEELPPEKRPRITRLFFELGCNMRSAPPDQCLLRVRSIGPAAGTIIECGPADKAGRGNGLEQMVRIYSKGASVRLRVPFQVGESSFAAWDLIGSQVYREGINETDVSVELNGHVRAECHWNRPYAPEPPLTVDRVTIPEEVGAALKRAAGGGHEEVKQALATLDEKMRNSSATRSQARGLPMRVEPSDEALTVEVAPMLDDTELIKEGEDGWKLVNYRGVVGWVNTSGRGGDSSTVRS